MRAVEALMRANYEHYVGNQSGAILELLFSQEPSSEEKADIQAYWDGLASDSDEAESYQSREDVEADRASKKASGKAKLAALGLTEEEISALLG